jgi:hypothetical protein
MCFVDFTNAFPSTWQDGMWSRLREIGVKGRLYRSRMIALQALQIFKSRRHMGLQIGLCRT